MMAAVCTVRYCGVHGGKRLLFISVMLKFSCSGSVSIAWHRLRVVARKSSKHSFIEDKEFLSRF